MLSFASSYLPNYKKNFFFSFLLSKNGLLIALSYGVTNLAFNWAIAEGNVVRVVFLFYLMPIWASIFAVILIKEKTKKSERRKRKGKRTEKEKGKRKEKKIEKKKEKEKEKERRKEKREISMGKKEKEQEH